MHLPSEHDKGKKAGQLTCRLVWLLLINDRCSKPVSRFHSDRIIKCTLKAGQVLEVYWQWSVCTPWCAILQWKCLSALHRIMVWQSVAVLNGVITGLGTELKLTTGNKRTGRFPEITLGKVQLAMRTHACIHLTGTPLWLDPLHVSCTATVRNARRKSCGPSKFNEGASHPEGCMPGDSNLVWFLMFETVTHTTAVTRCSGLKRTCLCECMGIIRHRQAVPFPTARPYEAKNKRPRFSKACGI